MHVIQVKTLQMMANHQQQQTDEDRDTERALQLFNAPTTERDAAFMRLRGAVRAGDIDAMRAAYEGGNGFIIGTGASQGFTETLVITEVLNNSHVPLELLSVFFQELGGRFMVGEGHGVCVFSMLIEVEGTKHIPHAEEAERWTLCLA